MCKSVLISIDTEGPCGKDPVEHLIYGVTETGERAGIELLMDIFDSNGVKGLFFVDIAEAWDCGYEKISGVLKLINKRGHDVGVHIHPDRMADKNRRYLWQYTEEEQREIIRKCTCFYTEVLGKRPRSFRAGRYGVNDTTIQILREYGYSYEMSLFYGNKYCRLSQYPTCNKIVDMDGLREVPVTSYRSFRSPFYTRFDKLDCCLKKGEFKRLVKHISTDETVDVASLFMHSFSLLDWRTRCDLPRFRKLESEKIDFQIKYMKSLGFEFISEEVLSNITPQIFNPDMDVTDYSKGVINLFYFIRRAANVIISRLQNNI